MKKQIVAKRKYGNKYFDMMEVEIEQFPRTAVVELEMRNDSRKRVSIPSAKIWTNGDFVARRYAGWSMIKAQNYLRSINFPLYNVRFLTILNSPQVIADPSYS